MEVQWLRVSERRVFINRSAVTVAKYVFMSFFQTSVRSSVSLQLWGFEVWERREN